MRTSEEGRTVTPPSVSGESDGWSLVGHHKTSVFAGFIGKRFAAIYWSISSMQVETRLAHVAVITTTSKVQLGIVC